MGGQYQKSESLSSVATSSHKNYSASHPHGLHQIGQFLLGAVTPLFLQGTCMFSNISGGGAERHRVTCCLTHCHDDQRPVPL